jgi:phosphoglycerate dehydrogenase-like enzyme
MQPGGCSSRRLAHHESAIGVLVHAGYQVQKNWQGGGSAGIMFNSNQPIVAEAISTMNTKSASVSGHHFADRGQSCPILKIDGDVLVLIPVEARHKAILESQAPADTRFVYRTEASVTRTDVEESVVIIGNPPPEMIRSCHRLRLLQLSASGAEAYMAVGVMPERAVLANAAGAYGLAISEHMLAMLLCLMKKLHLYLDNQHQAVWRSEGPVVSVWNARILVIGLGDIGSEFARRIKAMGAYTIGIRRTAIDQPDWLDELHHPDQLDNLLRTAYVVALCVPASVSTRHLLSAERIKSLKPDAFILNVGRGSAIDTDALTDALASGRLAGAGLDVTDPEPLPPDHPLWKLKNVLITPHVSGGFHLAETRERIIGICADNLSRLFHGDPLINIK